MTGRCDCRVAFNNWDCFCHTPSTAHGDAGVGSPGVRAASMLRNVDAMRAPLRGLPAGRAVAGREEGAPPSLTAVAPRAGANKPERPDARVSTAEGTVRWLAPPTGSPPLDVDGAPDVGTDDPDKGKAKPLGPPAFNPCCLCMPADNDARLGGWSLLRVRPPLPAVWPRRVAEAGVGPTTAASKEGVLGGPPSSSCSELLSQ